MLCLNNKLNEIRTLDCRNFEGLSSLAFSADTWIRRFTPASLAAWAITLAPSQWASLNEKFLEKIIIIVRLHDKSTILECNYKNKININYNPNINFGEAATSAKVALHVGPLSWLSWDLGMLVIQEEGSTLRKAPRARQESSTSSTHLWHWAGIKPKPQQWEVSTPKCLSLLLLWFSWQMMCLGSCPLTKWEWKIYLLAGKSTHPEQEEGSFSNPVNVHVPCFILSSDQVDHAIWVLDHFSHRLDILQVIILSAITFIQD